MSTTALSGIRFKTVRAQGAMGRNGLIRAWTMENESDHGRVGFSVTGCKTAVQRNRVRRRVRNAFTAISMRRHGFDTVLSAPAAAAKADFAELSQDVEIATAKAQRNWKSSRA